MDLLLLLVAGLRHRIQAGCHDRLLLIAIQGSSLFMILCSTAQQDSGSVTDPWNGLLCGSQFAVRRLGAALAEPSSSSSLITA